MNKSKLTFSIEKALNKNNKEYTYMQLWYVKEDGTLVPVKRVFFSELELEVINQLEEKEVKTN